MSIEEGILYILKDFTEDDTVVLGFGSEHLVLSPEARKTLVWALTDSGVTQAFTRVEKHEY